MIKIEELKELIKLVLYSSYIYGEKPLSLFIISRVGMGKSELLKKFKLTDNIILCSDITYSGIIELIKNNPSLKHIIIPDFIKITMRKKSTTDNFISILNDLTEEGLFEIRMQNMKENFKGRTVGIITATTSDSWESNKSKWEDIGFSSRMLKISYSHSKKTKEDIFNYIYERGYLKESKKEKIKFPKNPVKITLSSELSKQLKKETTTYRSQKQMQLLALSSALIRNSKKVEQQDINKVINLSKFINMEFTEI